MAKNLVFTGSTCVLPINFSTSPGGRDESSIYIIPDDFEQIIKLIKNPKQFLADIHSQYVPANPTNNPVWEVDEKVAILFKEIEESLSGPFNSLITAAYSSAGLAKSRKFDDVLAIIHFENKSMSISVHYKYLRNSGAKTPNMTHKVQPVNVTKVQSTTFAMTHFDIELQSKNEVESAEVKAHLVYDMITNGDSLQEYFTKSGVLATYSEGSATRLGFPPISNVVNPNFNPVFIVKENPTILVERAIANPVLSEPAPPVCDTMTSIYDPQTGVVTVVSAVIQDYA